MPIVNGDSTVKANGANDRVNMKQNKLILYEIEPKWRMALKASMR